MFEHQVPRQTHARQGDRRAVGLVTALICVLGGVSHAQSADPDPLFAPATDGGYRYFSATQSGEPLLDTPSPDAEQVGILEPGAILLNLGCKTYEHVMWCEGEPLNGDNRGFVPAERVEPLVGSDGAALTGPDDSKKRARAKDFDQTGKIKCAQNEGESLGQCRIQVAHAGGGDATAIVTFGNSFTRELYFRLGDFMRANTTMSGVGKDIEWERQGDIYKLRVDDQRFEIPAAYILGEPQQ